MSETLQPADRELIERESALPGMPTVLDPAALAGLAGDAATCRYLRYKPGTSLLASIRAGREDLLLTAYPPGSGRLRRLAERAERMGALRALDPARGLVLADATVDRALPGLAVARRRHRALRGVVYKAGRRWVGIDGERVVKVHAPDAAVRAVRAHWRAAAHLETASLRGVDPDLGIVETAFVPGTGMRSLPGVERDRAAHRVGAAIARLHDVRAGASTDGDRSAESRAALDGVSAVAPWALERAERVAAIAGAARAGRGHGRLVHGDFSADQVVVREDGSVVILDLDPAGTGDPLDDLARWRAAAVVDGAPGEDGFAALAAGYASVRPVSLDALDALTAGALVLRLIEPFRLRRRDWAARVEAILARAERLAGIP